jgi:hypothetical protein
MNTKQTERDEKLYSLVNEYKNEFSSITDLPMLQWMLNTTLGFEEGISRTAKITALQLLIRKAENNCPVS